MPIPQPTAAERFATILRGLSQAVAARTGWSLTLQLIRLIIERIRDIRHRVARIAARVQDGKYAPRRFAHRRPPAEPKPWQPSKLPQKFGWLLQLLPEAIGFRGRLDSLLRDPEMAALLAAAPASLSRPIRSLCWMLRIEPPPILARPPRARPATAAPPTVAATAGEARPAPKPRQRPGRPRYVFGLRYPPPFKNPA